MGIHTLGKLRGRQNSLADIRGVGKKGVRRVVPINEKNLNFRSFQVLSLV